MGLLGQFNNILRYKQGDKSKRNEINRAAIGMRVWCANLVCEIVGLSVNGIWARKLYLRVSTTDQSAMRSTVLPSACEWESNQLIKK